MSLMQIFEERLRQVLEEVLAADLAGEVTQRVLAEARPALERQLADFTGLPLARPAPRGRPAAGQGRPGRPRRQEGAEASSAAAAEGAHEGPQDAAVALAEEIAQ